MSLRSLLLPALCVPLCALCLALCAGGAQAATAVHTYHPQIPKGAPVAGNCWTSSIATSRPDAYRCMNGNAISDPCFATEKPDIVVCDPDPANGKPGFALRQKGALPASPTVAGAPAPWLVQLRDGTTCSPLTGTRPLVHELVVAYSCTPAKGQPDDVYAGLAEHIDSSSATWYARRIAYRSGKNGAELVASTRVPLAAVWR